MQGWSSLRRWAHHVNHLKLAVHLPEAPLRSGLCLGEALWLGLFFFFIFFFG